MLRLTALLCASMFVTMLVGGRDYGQLRPGLLAAKEAAAVAVVAKAAPETRADVQIEPQVIEASFTPIDAPADTAGITALAMPLVQPPAQVEAVVAEPIATQGADAPSNIWYVDARSVNVRMGPSTDDAILGRLTHGEAATVLDIDTTGWAHIVIEGDGIDGFVSSEFLTPNDPTGN